MLGEIVPGASLVKWKKQQQSEHIQDRRGRTSTAVRGGALGGGAVILAILAALFGGNIFGGGSSGGSGDVLGDILDQINAGSPVEPGQGPPVDTASDTGTSSDDEAFQFMNAMLIDIQDTWTEIFAASGETYPPATLVIFSGSTNSACGGATASVGPHYCPLDSTVYIDLDFYNQLASQFGAPGDFAQAYVLAHEIGHHIQNVLGIDDEVRAAQQQDPGAANQLSVRMELQADCLAGVWAYSIYQEDLLESGDLEEGLAAASAVGDDRIQKQATGMVNPETWTHGSSAQRVDWFTRGFHSGDPAVCDTFSGDI